MAGMHISMVSNLTPRCVLGPDIPVVHLAMRYKYYYHYQLYTSPSAAIRLHVYIVWPIVHTVTCSRVILTRVDV